jgi:hypothetical protein
VNGELGRLDAATAASASDTVSRGARLRNWNGRIVGSSKRVVVQERDYVCALLAGRARQVSHRWARLLVFVVHTSGINETCPDLSAAYLAIPRRASRNGRGRWRQSGVAA